MDICSFDIALITRIFIWFSSEIVEGTQRLLLYVQHLPIFFLEKTQKISIFSIFESTYFNDICRSLIYKKGWNFKPSSPLIISQSRSWCKTKVHSNRKRKGRIILPTWDLTSSFHALINSPTHQGKYPALLIMRCSIISVLFFRHNWKEVRNMKALAINVTPYQSDLDLRVNAGIRT